MATARVGRFQWAARSSVEDTKREARGATTSCRERMGQVRRHATRRSGPRLLLHNICTVRHTNIMQFAMSYQ